MRTWRLLLPLLIAAIAGCPGGGATDVDVNKLVVTRTGPNTITVAGQPGVVTALAATSVTLTVNRATYGSPTPTPTATPTPDSAPSPSLPPGVETYHLQHLGNHIPIAASYALLAPDGSFSPVTLGGPDARIQPGDELDVTPEKGTEQVGYTVYVTIP